MRSVNSVEAVEQDIWGGGGEGGGGGVVISCAACRTADSNKPFSHKLFGAASDSLKASSKYIRLLQQCLKPPNSLTSSVLHVCCK